MNLKDSLLGLIIVLAWGVNFVVIAIGLESMPPLLMGGLRFLLVAVLGCWFVSLPKIPLKWILAYALTLGFAQFAFLFIAMAVGMPAGLASLVLQSQAFLTLIFAFFILKEQIKMTQILAILVAGSGLTVIGIGSDQASMTLIGFSLTLIAAGSWATGNLVTRTISQRGYKADVSLVIWSAFFSCIPFFILSYVIDGPDVIRDSLINMSLISIASLFYLALVATIFGYSLWNYLLARYPVSQVAPLTLGVPVIGLVSASMILEEQLGVVQLSGILFVMFGLIINIRLDKLLKRYLFGGEWRK